MKETNSKRIALDDELEEVNGGNILIGAMRGGLGTRLSNLLHLGGKAQATTLPATSNNAILSTLEHSADDIDKRTLLQNRAEESSDGSTFSL